MSNSSAPDKVPLWKVSPANGKYLINSVAVSADGGRVVGGTFYHDYGSKESRRGPASAAPPADATTSPDDGTFGVYCYNGTGQLQWKDEFAGWQGVYWTAISADGSRAAAGGLMSQQSPEGFLRAYDANNGGRQLLNARTKKRVNQVALSADGASLIVAAETLMLFRYVAARGAYEKFNEYQSISGDSIVSAAISGDGNTVVYSDFGGEVGVITNLTCSGYFTPMARWRVAGGGGIGDYCHMLDLAPDGKSFAAGGAKGHFYFFEVEKFFATNQPTCACATGVGGAVFGVAVAGNGSLFAGVVDHDYTGNGYLVPVVNGAAGPAKTFTTRHAPNGVVLNATHGMLAVADGYAGKQADENKGRFYLFDTATAAERWSCPSGKMSWPIAISAQGNAVVGGSDDSNIYYFTP